MRATNRFAGAIEGGVGEAGHLKLFRGSVFRGIWKLAFPFGELTFQASLQPVQHSDALLISFSKPSIFLQRDVVLESSNVKMVDCFGGFTSSAIDTFNLIPDVPVIVSFRQLGG